jgi:hypothetical protein
MPHTSAENLDWEKKKIEQKIKPRKTDPTKQHRARDETQKKEKILTGALVVLGLKHHHHYHHRHTRILTELD